MTILLTGLSVEFDEGFQLNNINWQIEQHQHWLITGANGAGKSALAAVLAGYGEILAGSTSGLLYKIGWVSFEAQAELIQAEHKLLGRKRPSFKTTQAAGHVLRSHSLL